MSKTALITGVTGQDGSYLAEFLLTQGYKVYGLVRNVSDRSFSRINHILDRIQIVEGDLLDRSTLISALEKVGPDEVYNLAAQSFVPLSWKQPELTTQVNSMGVLNLLESIRNFSRAIKFYQASSSEMFGKAAETPQKEFTPFYPRSPYGVSKCYGHYLTVNYRESYGLFAASGILFNHESPRRGLNFVTRKVTHGVARIVHGLDSQLALGNLSARRDWGFAGDYVKAMWLMLQQSQASDYVVATGKMHSVQQLVEIAFGHVGLDWEKYVTVDKLLYRPAEVDALVGDASKAFKELGWEPKVEFSDMIREMVEADLKLVDGQLVKKAGRK